MTVRQNQNAQHFKQSRPDTPDMIRVKSELSIPAVRQEQRTNRASRIISSLRKSIPTFHRDSASRELDSADEVKTGPHTWTVASLLRLPPLAASSVHIHPIQSGYAYNEQRKRRKSPPPASSIEHHHHGSSSLQVIQDASSAIVSEDQNETTWCRIHKHSLIECASYLISCGLKWVGGGLVLLLWILPGRLLDGLVWAPIRRALHVVTRYIIPQPNSGINHFFAWIRHEKHRVSSGQGHKKYVYASGVALWARRTMLASSSSANQYKKRWPRGLPLRRSQRDPPDWH